MRARQESRRIERSWCVTCCGPTRAFIGPVPNYEDGSEMFRFSGLMASRCPRCFAQLIGWRVASAPWTARTWFWPPSQPCQLTTPSSSGFNSLNARTPENGVVVYVLAPQHFNPPHILSETHIGSDVDCSPKSPNLLAKHPGHERVSLQSLDSYEVFIAVCAMSVGANPSKITAQPKQLPKSNPHRTPPTYWPTANSLLLSSFSFDS